MCPANKMADDGGEPRFKGSFLPSFFQGPASDFQPHPSTIAKERSLSLYPLLSTSLPTVMLVKSLTQTFLSHRHIHK